MNIKDLEVGKYYSSRRPGWTKPSIFVVEMFQGEKAARRVINFGTPEQRSLPFYPTKLRDFPADTEIQLL